MAAAPTDAHRLLAAELGRVARAQGAELGRLARVGVGVGVGVRVGDGIRVGVGVVRVGARLMVRAQSSAASMGAFLSRL